MGMPQGAALAKRIDDAIQYRAGVEPTAYGLLMAIRWTLNNLVGEDVTMGASGLILDVLHAQTED